MSIHGESIGRALCAEELTAANERIRELEAEAIRFENAWDSAYQQAMENGQALTAERAISDKMEKALGTALNSMYQSSYHPLKTEPMGIMEAALDGVAAMRKGEKV